MTRVLQLTGYFAGQVQELDYEIAKRCIENGTAMPADEADDAIRQELVPAGINPLADNLQDDPPVERDGDFVLVPKDWRNFSARKTRKLASEIKCEPVTDAGLAIQIIEKYIATAPEPAQEKLAA